MILPGLSSVTFRQLTPARIVQLARQAGLSAIEWGGDLHVPPGNLDVAKRVRDLTLSTGLQISSYGSYYRAGKNQSSFSDILATTLTLQTKTIRVWAGSVGSQEASADVFAAVVSDLKTCSQQAAQSGVSLALEFHDGTLTDTNESALRLLDLVPDVSIIWQPKTLFDRTYRLAGLQALLPRLGNLHVFHWDQNFARLPLADGSAEWTEYFALAKSQPEDRFALLEFVAEDDPERFFSDAATLRELLA